MKLLWKGDVKQHLNDIYAFYVYHHGTLSNSVKIVLTQIYQKQNSFVA